MKEVKEKLKQFNKQLNNNIELYKKQHYEMSDCDYHILKHALLTNPKYICIGFISKSFMESLITLQLAGVIKHLLFYDCDPVECYILIEWS